MNDKKIISNMLLQAKKNYSIAKTEHWLNFFSYRIETLELVLAEIEKHSFFNRLINFFQKMRSTMINLIKSRIAAYKMIKLKKKNSKELKDSIRHALNDKDKKKQELKNQTRQNCYFMFDEEEQEILNGLFC